MRGTFIENFALRNNVSGTDTKTRNEMSTLVEVLTSEAHPRNGRCDGQFTNWIFEENYPNIPADRLIENIEEV